MDIKPNTELAKFLGECGESLRTRLKEAGKPTPPLLVQEFKALSILQVALSCVSSPEHISKIEAILRNDL